MQIVSPQQIMILPFLSTLLWLGDLPLFAPLLEQNTTILLAQQIGLPYLQNFSFASFDGDFSKKSKAQSTPRKPDRNSSHIAKHKLSAQAARSSNQIIDAFQLKLKNLGGGTSVDRKTKFKPLIKSTPKTLEQHSTYQNWWFSFAFHPVHGTRI